jgi:hypothetical protein
MRKLVTRVAMGLLLVLIALVPLGSVTGREPSLPAVCEEIAFSTEEDFWTKGPTPPDGNSRISDGDLLSTNHTVCARNADLVEGFDVSQAADLGLDAADVIDAESYLVAFSTELDSPNTGQFTAGDLLTTNGVIIPNLALVHPFAVGYDIGLDALHFVGDKRAIIGFLGAIVDSQLTRQYWLQNPGELKSWLQEYEIDIWFSTEGTWTPPEANGFLDGDLLSARDGAMVADNRELLPSGVPADVRDGGVDFGLDAVSGDRAGNKTQARFSTEILYRDSPSFTDGDVLEYAAGIDYTNKALIQPFEPKADFLGLDAFHLAVAKEPLNDIYLPIVLKAMDQSTQ